MINFLKIYAVAFAAFCAIDLIWLGFVANRLYSKHLGYIMRPSPNWTVAILFYLLYLAGVVWFVINPAIEKQSWKYALFAGMFFGLITYATYDLTNLATIKNWPFIVTVVDLCWGAFVSAAVSAISYTIAKKLGL